MYQHMQESLHDNLADTSLPPRMHRSVKKGLAKLEHYYNLAKLNHFNIIATGKYFHIYPKAFLQLMDLTVCHPALRLSWFQSINSDSYDRAKEVFEYHFQEYQASIPDPAPLQRASEPVESKSFLASIAHRSSSSLFTAATPQPASEHERYALLEHGIQERDALENPLMWWKVSTLRCCSCKLLTVHYRPINMNFLSLHKWPVISWLFLGLWYLLNAYSQSPVISALTSAQL